MSMWIKNRPIIALAPMADFTDSPFSQICRQTSGKGFVIFREMVSAEAIVRESIKTHKMCEFGAKERPVVQQIFGSNPKVIVEAAEIIMQKYGPDGIDINMGCPVPKISEKAHAGAALMKDIDLAVKIVKTLKHANLGVPVSVKTRLGWLKDNEILSFAIALEQAGVDLLTIHGRTKRHGYDMPVNWHMIGQVKLKVSIPVIANGDIKTHEDVQKCLDITKADGVMIGRAALGHPWILGAEKEEKTIKDIKKIVLKHAKLHVKHYGSEKGLITFRKHLAFYFSHKPGMKQFRIQLMQVSNLVELEEILSCL